MKTHMPSQPHSNFPIENNGDKFLTSNFSSIDSMLTGDNQDLAMLSEM